jgi:DNA-binding CsgD family transcriptional regulator
MRKPASSTKGGPISLSPRQKQVHSLLLMGKSTGDIARGLGLSRPTAAMHVSRVYRKFGVGGKVQLLALSLAAAHSAANGTATKRAA